MNLTSDLRSRVEIDLNQICENYRLYRAALPAGQKVMAVVKANAYGHGDVDVASALQERGVMDFAVATLEEAITLRRAGIRGQILILGYTPPGEAKTLSEYDLTQALLSQEYAVALEHERVPVKCHYAIDTGMRRIGLCADDVDTCEKEIRRVAQYLNLTGLFTHLCVADTEDQESLAFTASQLARFEAVCHRVSDLHLPYCHSLNSAGGLRYAGKTDSDFVRLGIILYGLKPDVSNTLPEGIYPALSWKSVVSMVKTVFAGDTIGYGRTYIAKTKRRIATIPTGYADGYPRALSGKGEVLIAGQRAKIVGRVCMDQMMVDITDIQNVSMGDEVILIGADGNERITADDLAQASGTIGYEIVCGISSRVARFVHS